MLEIKDKMFGREKECKMRKADDWRMSQIRERGFFGPPLHAFFTHKYTSDLLVMALF